MGEQGTVITPAKEEKTISRDLVLKFCEDAGLDPDRVKKILISGDMMTAELYHHADGKVHLIVDCSDQERAKNLASNKYDVYNACTRIVSWKLA